MNDIKGDNGTIVMTIERKNTLKTAWQAGQSTSRLGRNDIVRAPLGSMIKDTESISAQDIPLRVFGQLIRGIARIYERQGRYLLEDMDGFLFKIKKSFITEKSSTHSSSKKGKGKTSALKRTRSESDTSFSSFDQGGRRRILGEISNEEPSQVVSLGTLDSNKKIRDSSSEMAHESENGMWNAPAMYDLWDHTALVNDDATLLEGDTLQEGSVADMELPTFEDLVNFDKQIDNEENLEFGDVNVNDVLTLTPLRESDHDQRTFNTVEQGRRAIATETPRWGGDDFELDNAADNSFDLIDYGADFANPLEGDLSHGELPHMSLLSEHGLDEDNSMMVLETDDQDNSLGKQHKQKPRRLAIDLRYVIDRNASLPADETRSADIPPEDIDPPPRLPAELFPLPGFSAFKLLAANVTFPSKISLVGASSASSVPFQQQNSNVDGTMPSIDQGRRGHSVAHDTGIDLLGGNDINSHDISAMSVGHELDPMHQEKVDATLGNISLDNITMGEGMTEMNFFDDSNMELNDPIGFPTIGNHDDEMNAFANDTVMDPENTPVAQRIPQTMVRRKQQQQHEGIQRRTELLRDIHNIIGHTRGGEISFDAVCNESHKETRREKCRAFVDILALATQGSLNIQQNSSYGEILIQEINHD